MADLHNGDTLLDQLDSRQEEVLQGLNELNTEVESLLRKWSLVREEGAGPSIGSDKAAVSLVQDVNLVEPK